MTERQTGVATPNRDQDRRREVKKKGEHRTTVSNLVQIVLCAIGLPSNAREERAHFLGDGQEAWNDE
jgi:hypothetical protein